MGKVSFFAGDLARQTAFDSILGHVNGQGVGQLSAPCPFGDSLWGTAGEKPPAGGLHRQWPLLHGAEPSSAGNQGGLPRR